MFIVLVIVLVLGFGFLWVAMFRVLLRACELPACGF